MSAEKNRKVCVVMVGGTLAMAGADTGGGPRPSVGLDALLADLPMQAGLSLVPLSWHNEPSSFMKSTDMVGLARLIKENGEDGSVVGTVVLHGTDTLEETAFAVSLLTSPHKPVVFTGSMKRYDELGYDGISNIRDAITVAASPEAAGRGTLVSFGGNILEAAGVEKVRTIGARPFDDVWNGPCGYFYQGRLRFLRGAAVYPGTFPDLVEGVGLLRVYSGMQEEAVSAFAAVCSRGLVLEAFGIGSLPFSILEVVRNTLSRDVPVIITSQAAQGWTAPVYGFPGGGKYLEQMGCVFAGWLSGRKARLLLMAALSAQSGVNLTAVYAPYN